MPDRDDLAAWKERLQKAVQDQPVDPWLHVRIRRTLRQEAPPPLRWPGRRRLLAAATVLAAAVSIGIFVRYRKSSDPSAALIAAAPVGMRAAVGDHLRCRILHGPGRNFDARYRELAAALARQAPAEYRIFTAHECTYEGQRLTHVGVRWRNLLVSLIVANGAHSGPDRASAGALEIAAERVGVRTLFVVSSLPPRENERIFPVLLNAAAQYYRGVHSSAGKTLGVIPEQTRLGMLSEPDVPREPAAGGAQSGHFIGGLRFDPFRPEEISQKAPGASAEYVWN